MTTQQTSNQTAPTPTTAVGLWGQAISLDLDAVSAFAVVTGYLYLTGYLITAITLRNYGIHRFEAIKLQYIEAGVAFTVLACALALVPIITAITYYRVRVKSGLPNLWLGLIGYVSNFTILIFLLTFFAMFVTAYDWSQDTPIRVFRRWSLSEIFYIYASFSMFEVVLLPVVERLIVGRAQNPRVWYRWLVEPCRYFIVLLSLAFVVVLWHTLPWLKTWLQHIIPFFLTLVSMLLGFGGIRFWIHKVGTPETMRVISLLGAVGLIILFYVSINAYVFGVVRMLPINRGGRLPVTQTFFVSDSKVLKALPLQRDSLDGSYRWGPVYVVEESSDRVYVATANGGDWTREWNPIVAISKSAITFTTSERIRDGAPRTGSRTSIPHQQAKPRPRPGITPVLPAKSP